MNILIIIPSFYPAVIYGGPIFTSFHTCNELKRIGVQFKVVTTNANGKSKLEEVEPNIFIDNFGYPVKYYNETVIGKFSWSLFKSIKRDIQNADIVHIQGLFSTPIPVSIYWASKLKKRIVLTPHGTLGKWCLKQNGILKKIWLNWFIKPYLKKIIWHATAETEKKEILQVFPNANVKVIANGIYLKEFANSNRLTKLEFVKQYSQQPVKLISNVNKIIISAGRLQKKKGFDILINAFNKVLKNFPDSVLFIAGEDEGERDNLISLTKSLNISDKVVLTGLINGQLKVDFFANADLFVLPSHNENFGIVYTEALAAKTPIVASTNTPWEEVEEAGCGRWVPNTVEDTANAMLTLFASNRDVLSKNALEYVKRFDWSNIAIEFKNFYKTLENES
jgi:glycosyltransferase involved in cell wall biosynthesis